MNLKREYVIILATHFIIVAHSYSQQLAFPGAEGFGRFTAGGRGGNVIEVTTLKDGGLGSLRNAIESDGARTVVIRISGTIELKSELIIRNDSLTIAGQTTPGDGICIKNYPMIIDANDVIIRFLRFRPGDEMKIEGDAISCCFQHNIIIDHCSMSWGNDEVGTFRDNENTTVQWCLVTESLHNSCHHKGAHGYGGIWGGMGATFHHNLLAHHSSRNPRFNGSRYHKEPNKEIVDFRNNVIYNWGSNSGYGGEKGNQNVINNYYKYGPATSPGPLQYRIVNPWDIGRWYILGNIVYGFPNVSVDNWNGGVQCDFPEKVRVKSPHPFEPVITHTADAAYELVLAHAGAVLPKRDAIDTRIIAEVSTGTATYGGLYGIRSGIIDSQTDVNGWPELNTYNVPVDKDRDGMDDQWERNHGLNPSDPSDRNHDYNGDGYTNLEKYLNRLTVREDFILPPFGLKSTAVSSSQIDLFWQENVLCETGFSIERSDNDSSSFSEIARVVADNIHYQDTNLSPQTRYIYRIRAYKDQVYSIYSNTISATTLDENVSEN